MNRIESLLRKEIGLDAASIGSSLIERTVRLRMKRLALKHPGDYERLLDSSRAEWEELIEAVVVTETWFFRDRDPFSAFTQLALEWFSQHPTSGLRVLSVPCSSGEEPYSLAMALLDANAPPQRLVIDAVDISAATLDRARQAVYGKNSFRGKELDFRDRHFQHTKEGYALNPRVRDCVQFHRDNLLDEEFLVGHAPYDFVFCRNLLIYFDRVTQVQALHQLHRLLTPDGLLFVGPAELPLVIDNGFVNANLPMAFACRKATRIARRERNPFAAAVSSAPWGKAEIPKAESRNPFQLSQFQLSALPPPRASAAHVASGVPSALDAARQLADAGRLEDAAAICEEHLRKEGPSAQAYYLLGLLTEVRGARGQVSGEPDPLHLTPGTSEEQAIDYYRKALYLEPNHYETLLQMSLLLEKTGDTAGARTFKSRLARGIARVEAEQRQEEVIPQAKARAAKAVTKS